MRSVNAFKLLAWLEQCCLLILFLKYFLPGKIGDDKHGQANYFSSLNRNASRNIVNLYGREAPILIS